jgi:imidazolonepropionase-like amidohydrolase
VTDPAQLEPGNVVDAIKSDGAICVKTVQDDYLPATMAQMKSLVAATHAKGLPLLIHANRTNSQDFAVQAGVDIIVHGMWRNPAEPAALDQKARDILARVARDGIGYQPTTQVIAGLVDMHRPDYLSQPQLADVYPGALIEFYRGPNGSVGVPEWIRDGGPQFAPHAADTARRSVEVTRILGQANARLLFGSDTPSDGLWSNPAGLNGRTEMGHWVAAGVSLKKLFTALTLDNARALRLEDKIGTVETGKTANLLLLRANPLESVDAYDSIETVFLHGRPIPRAGLSARGAAN